MFEPYDDGGDVVRSEVELQPQLICLLNERMACSYRVVAFRDDVDHLLDDGRELVSLCRRGTGCVPLTDWPSEPMPSR